MRTLIVMQAAVTALLAALIAPTQDHTATVSVLSGALASALNLIFLVVSWPLILQKKQVALGMMGIVFKFALLVGILYFVAESKIISLGWFAIGLGTVIPSVILATVFEVNRGRSLQLVVAGSRKARRRP